MQNTTKHIYETLNTLYPPEEIRCFIRVILSHVCGLSYNQQILCKDKQISVNEKNEIYDIVSRLKELEPLQYILGETEFYSLPFKVNPSVLIPRPETEELVDMIIKSLTVQQRNGATYPLHILDIGTGSGCIPVVLAKHISGSIVTAVDISETALQTAKGNAALNDVDIRFIQSDILNTPESIKLIPGLFNIIVSNPPYITEREKHLMNPNVLDHEPHVALFVPNEDPLLFYKTIADFALQKLAPKGVMFFEINAEYGTETCDMLHNKGFSEIELIRDLSGKNRFITANFQLF